MNLPALRRWRMLLLAITLVATPASSASLQLLTEEWPPITFSDHGRPAGLAVDVVREIQRRLGQSDPIHVLPWARAWQMAITKPNVLLFTVTRTPEREQLFTFVGPVALGTTDLYARRGSGLTLRTLDDARRAGHIGVYASAVEEQLLRSEGFTNLDAAPEPLDAARKLMAGRIDLWCNANLTVADILKQAGYQPNDVEKLLTLRENLLYLAFSRGSDPATVTQWEATLRAMKRDGSFERLYQAWLPGQPVPKTVERFGAR